MSGSGSVEFTKSNQNVHGSGAEAEQVVGPILGVQFQSPTVSRVVEENGCVGFPMGPIGEVSSLSGSSGVSGSSPPGLPLNSAIMAGAASILGGRAYSDHQRRERSPMPLRV